jgi:hypothetical protein
MVIRGDSELGSLLTLLVLFGGFVGMLERVNTIARGGRSSCTNGPCCAFCSARLRSIGSRAPYFTAMARNVRSSCCSASPIHSRMVSRSFEAMS